MLTATCVSASNLSVFYLVYIDDSVSIAYDICEDEPTLDYIESEMAREGVTQEVNALVYIYGLNIR